MASQPDDELVKEVFAHHGLAVYLAHVLERSLVNALTTVYGPGPARLTERQLEQRFQDLVFSNLRSMLRARLVARRPMNYVDATNLTPHDRHSWIKLAKDFGYEVQAVYFDVPLEVCLERNHRRPRTVEDDVMRKMAAKLKAPTFEEGFSKITVVRVKAKE